MAYGTVKVDTIIFDQGGADQNVTVSGIYRAITSGVTVTGTISGAVLIGTTTVSGATVTGTTVQGISGTFTTLTGTTTTGTTANFASGVFTTRVSGTTITGTTAQFTSGTFVSLTGTTITGTTISGTTVSSTTGTFTSLTGTTTTGITVNFTSGVFTTQVSGATVTGTQSSFTSGNFVTLSGATATFTSGVIASGTAAAPSLSILGDPNTGIYSPGADTLAFVEGGVEAMRITSAGLVGIGTSSPGKTLDVTGTARVSSILTMGSYIQGTIQLDLYGDSSSSSGVRIDSSGRVGIGTTSPDGRLHVLQGTTPNIAQLYVGQGGGSSNYYDANNHYFRDGNLNSVISTTSSTIQLFTSNTERARIDSSGRLLVGTSTANANGGILQLTSGITFPATAVAASDPNTLDDYEEGTWTPTISNTGYTYTYSNQTGTYTKVGRTVTLSWRVVVTARSGSASGGLPIVSIPFTSSASFTGSALNAQNPAQLVIHKAGTGATSGIRTFLYVGFANSANTYFWIAAIDSSGDPFDIGADFHMGGVFIYEV